MRASNQERPDIQNIFGLNDQAPSGPDCACGGEGDVLSHRELLGWAVEIRYAGEDDAPL
jgi:hypothetical protein